MGRFGSEGEQKKEGPALVTIWELDWAATGILLISLHQGELKGLFLNLLLLRLRYVRRCQTYQNWKRKIRKSQHRAQELATPARIRVVRSVWRAMSKWGESAEIKKRMRHVRRRVSLWYDLSTSQRRWVACFETDLVVVQHQARPGIWMLTTATSVIFRVRTRGWQQRPAAALPSIIHQHPRQVEKTLSVKVGRAQ